MAREILRGARHDAAQGGALDQAAVVADVSLAALRVLGDPVAGRDVGAVVEAGSRDRHGEFAEAAAGEEVLAFMDLLHHRAVAYDLRLEQVIHRVDPSVRDLLGRAFQPQAIDFSGGRQSADQDGALVFSLFRVGHVFKQEGLAIGLFQAAKLPAHQGMKLGIFVDLPLDAQEPAVLLEGRDQLAQVVIGFGKFHGGLRPFCMPFQRFSQGLRQDFPCKSAPDA